ncbi:unnamed protein product [Larinioides sclopetarius]|uniref:BTB domain-containing protein n=1 Tax=Larinioides sclopetarius TaxID=280406 RepID=A0AAV1YTN8_9ARAC
MSCEGECEKKCFTFIWKLENASYCWQKQVFLDSPVFKVDELEKSKWKLSLYEIIGEKKGSFELRLQRDDKGVEKVKLNFELAFLASDGTVLQSFKKEEIVILGNQYFGNRLASRNEVFFTRRSVFLPQDTLTARCRMWKSVGEFTKEVQYFARTRIVVEKRSFLWNIENFSTLESDAKRTYEIKSQDTDEQLICLELFVSRKKILDETIRIAIIHKDPIKSSFFQLFIVDASKNLLDCFQDEFSYHDSIKRKEFDLFLTKRKLMENKIVYLPNNSLSLQCEFSFSSGILKHEETKIYDCSTLKNEPTGYLLLKENDVSVPIGILIDDLKSMLNNSLHSDIKLKTSSHSYPAHKCILSTRSPVFEAMFSTDMKEKIDNCVDIGDLKEDTILRMLRYIYGADVGELEWTSATELYEAADKYQILNLKDMCSSFLKNNLRPSNACKALILADLHEDQDLKGFVQDFILSYGKNIVNSDEWNQLLETNAKLAAETTRLKFKG